MKKIWLALLLAIVPLRLQAAITDEGVTREKTVVIHFSTTIVADRFAAFDLISLSTTAGVFPHTDRGEIDISHINVMVDKVAAATCTVRIGALTFVNPSTGTARFFYTYASEKNVSNTGIPPPSNFTPSFYRCRVKPGATPLVDGTLPFILSNDIRTSTITYNTQTAIPGPAGAIVPQVGDIVMEVLTGPTNTINLFVDVWYHSEP